MENPIHYREFNSFSRKWCIDRTKEMSASSYSFFFREHPKNSVPNYDEYLLVVKNPMWFKEVQERLTHNMYVYIHEWIVDMESIWNNALTYNAKNTPGYDSALVLKKMFLKKCVPVPSSQKNYYGIKKYKILRKLVKNLLNPPPMIKNLRWEIPKIPAESLDKGDDLVLEMRNVLFQIEPEVREALFANPLLKKVIENPQEIIDEISDGQKENEKVSEEPEKNEEQDQNENIEHILCLVHDHPL